MYGLDRSAAYHLDAESDIMNWIKNGIRRAAKYAGIPLRDPALVSMLGSQPTAAGVDIDEISAMNYSAVWAAVNLIASNFAAMPIIPYHGVDDNRTRATDHWSYELLTLEINDEMTPFAFFETWVSHAETWGNGYGHIERVHRDAPATAIRLLPPNQVTPQRTNSGQIVYHFKSKYPGEKDRDFAPWEVLHLAGPGFDGLQGYSVIDHARESIGLGAAVEKYGAGFFGRGSVPGGVLEVPLDLNLSEKAKRNLRESWELLHRGPDNAHRIALLFDGIQHKALGIPPDAAQFLKTRQFQISEIARWFNVPPHLLRDLTQSTNNNIEHQGIDFLVYTMRPWLLRSQQEIRRKLFTSKERKIMSVDHDVHNLLMTDAKTRYEGYNTGRNTGFLTLNDILRTEKMNTIDTPFGDSRLVPLNMQTVDDRGNAVSETPGEVQATAMNGVQITALLAVVTAAGQQSIDPDTAEQVILAAFPELKPAQIAAMLKPIREGKINVKEEHDDGAQEPNDILPGEPGK